MSTKTQTSQAKPAAKAPAAVQKTGSDVLIRTRDLHVTYPNSSVWGALRGEPGYTAIRGLTFELRPGERLGLLGRNGTGKSTLLRTLAGVYPPSGGELTIRGTRSSIFNAASGFEANATGRENITFRGVLLGLSRERIRELTPSIIEFSELGDWIEKPVYTYSSGMLLRLAFSIVTALENDILLMDEWIGAGDAGFIEKAQARMDVMLEHSKIIVLATHNMPLVERVCERSIVLSDGKALFDGDTKEAIAIYREIRDHSD